LVPLCERVFRKGRPNWGSSALLCA
jgi:hypothetical protein